MTTPPQDGRPEPEHTPRPHELNELQQLELQILLDVQAVCRELGIEFFLGEGTLLGAIRHRGFIPWDDDVDLLMKRGEYERFLELAPAKLAPTYEVQHATTVEGYWSPLMKVRLVAGDPAFRQAHIAHLTDHNGPVLDIFPMEYVPRPDGLRLRLQSAWIRLLRGALTQGFHTRPASRITEKVMRALGTVAPSRLLHHMLERAFRLHGDAERPWLATLASYRPLACQVLPATAYSPAATAIFEGHPMPVPHDAHQVLTTNYGDYLTPPPEHERVEQHEFERRPED